MKPVATVPEKSLRDSHVPATNIHPMNHQSEFGEGFGSPPGSSECVVCQPDYWFQTSTKTCVGCGIGTDFEGFDCGEGATTTATTQVKIGYWRIDLSSETILTCRRKEFCLGDQCREGHMGAYCALCEVGQRARRICVAPAAAAAAGGVPHTYVQHTPLTIPRPTRLLRNRRSISGR